MVTGTFPNYRSHNNEGSFSLEADQGFNPYTWRPPINWRGWVNNVAVSFIQVNASGGDLSDYDFSGFPPQFERAKPFIVAAIDDAMRVMD